MTEIRNEKKALLIASMASMLDNFNRGNIEILLELGYRVTLAANFRTGEDSNSQEKTKRFLEEMKNKGVQCTQIDFSRSVFSIRAQWKSFKQVQNLLQDKFSLIHCHSPICAAITRICAKKYRKTGTRVLYTAHGFHFFKGAPLQNWLLYYPVEKLMSHFTDTLITINKEDYHRAKKKFSAKRTVYVPGVGIDAEKFQNIRVNREEKRKELGLGKDDIFILSVGELNKNKNHEIILQAMAALRNKKINYMIAGVGEQREHLMQLAKEKHLSFTILGFREDVPELLGAADFFAFPSKREGLSASVMEAMFAQVPVIASKIRGNTDLIKQGENGILIHPNTTLAWEKGIRRALKKPEQFQLGEMKSLSTFESRNIRKKMKEIYIG